MQKTLKSIPVDKKWGGVALQRMEAWLASGVGPGTATQCPQGQTFHSSSWATSQGGPSCVQASTKTGHLGTTQDSSAALSSPELLMGPATAVTGRRLSSPCPILLPTGPLSCRHGSQGHFLINTLHLNPTWGSASCGANLGGQERQKW
jgi:hypothetical protein